MRSFVRCPVNRAGRRIPVAPDDTARRKARTIGPNSVSAATPELPALRPCRGVSLRLDDAQQLLFNLTMKTVQLSPVRLTAAVREQIESVLLEGETLSHFVEQAAIDAARRRKAQQDFVARGRASLARALESGESYAADEVLDAMKSRIDIARKAVDKGRAGISKRRA